MNRYKSKWFFILVCFVVLSCSKTPTKENNNINHEPNNTGKGTFSFKGKTYSGTCIVIPQSTDITTVDYPGFQWSMSIRDDSNDASLLLGMFPQNDAGEFGISNNESNVYNDRNGSISLGPSIFYKIKYGKIKKTSKTRFSIEGVAFADMSQIPIPFSAEGDILDLTDLFNITNKSPYPPDCGLISFYTNKPLNGDTLYISVWEDNIKSEFHSYGGTITYPSEMPYKCGESESFYYDLPGTYFYDATGISGLSVASGSFTVIANTCNPVLINR